MVYDGIKNIMDRIRKKSEEIEEDEEKLAFYKEAEEDNGFMLQVCALVYDYQPGASSGEQVTPYLEPIFERPAKLEYLLEVLKHYFEHKYGTGRQYRHGVTLNLQMIDRYRYGNYQDKEEIVKAVGTSMKVIKE